MKKILATALLFITIASCTKKPTTEEYVILHKDIIGKEYLNSSYSVTFYSRDSLLLKYDSDFLDINVKAEYQFNDNAVSVEDYSDDLQNDALVANPYLRLFAGKFNQNGTLEITDIHLISENEDKRIEINGASEILYLK